MYRRVVVTLRQTRLSLEVRINSATMLRALSASRLVVAVWRIIFVLDRMRPMADKL